MKHILNNISEEEKNAIREQHTGGMKVITENFSKLTNSKLGDSKPLVSEQAAALAYVKPPYCKVGQSQGTIVTAKTAVIAGPDKSLGETGFALSVNGKEVCLISTKYQQGGTVASATNKK
jgi:hypothetical protein